jgi:hypothetical protein
MYVDRRMLTGTVPEVPAAGNLSSDAAAGTCLSVLYDCIRFAIDDHFDAERRAEEASNPMHYEVGKPTVADTGVYKIPKYILWKPDSSTTQNFEFDLQKYLTQQKAKSPNLYVYDPQEGSSRGRLKESAEAPVQPFKSAAEEDNSQQLNKDPSARPLDAIPCHQKMQRCCRTQLHH